MTGAKVFGALCCTCWGQRQARGWDIPYYDQYCRAYQASAILKVNRTLRRRNSRKL